MDLEGRLLWEALLKQAGANLETARSMHLQTQHMLCKESLVDMEPDRLEAWYVAACDAEVGAGIARQIVHHAEGLCQDEQQSVGATAEPGKAGHKGPSLGKAAAAQATVAKTAVSTKRRVPSVLELFTAQGAAAAVAVGDRSLTDGIAFEAEERSSAGDNNEIGPGGLEVAKQTAPAAMLEAGAPDCKPVCSQPSGQPILEGKRDVTKHPGKDALEHVSQNDGASRATISGGSEGSYCDGLIKAFGAIGIQANFVDLLPYQASDDQLRQRAFFATKVQQA